MQPNIGIDEGNRQELAKGLSKLLADTYTLYLKTHNFHWNVTGPHFQQLHLMFMDQYTEMWAAVDEIAERIRALGEFAPGGYKAFASLSSIKESEGTPDWQAMISQLVNGHEEVIRTCRKLLPQVQEAGDESSNALIGDRLRIHEKTAWMLRSLLN
ncbi:MAG: DNA starvation/stationary phase protection protein [Planctomycetes bacterium]|nr:DNA starvation/stationary phase protection protein [Planctomycetota bacterium]